MKPFTAAKAGSLLLRGSLHAVELTMNVLAALVDPPSRRRPMNEGCRPLGGRVRTGLGTVEPVDYDEDGRRVGLHTRMPAARDE